MTTFKLPTLRKPTDPWGPSDTIETEEDIPYTPFSKSDRLGKTADWTLDPLRDGREQRQRQYGRYKEQYQVYGSGVASIFAYQHSEDESTFSVVDNRTGTKTRLGSRSGALLRGRGRGNLVRGSGRGNYFVRTVARGYQEANRSVRNGFQISRGLKKFGWKEYDKPQRLRDASVTVKHDWQLLEEIEFSRLAKMSFEVGNGIDLETYGFLRYYDKSYDKISTKAERLLQVIDGVHYNPTTTDDPVIQKLAMNNEANVFIVDSILSLLMCVTRSVYSWDIIVIRESDKLFFDKREGGPFDYVTVNENAADPPMEPSEGQKETINTSGQLSLEATYINQNFSQQALKDSDSEKYLFSNPNPFYNPEEETESLAARGYKYRKFNLGMFGDVPVSLICRTEVDAIVKNPSGEDFFCSIKALNEFDPRAQGAGGALDWRSKLDSQRGAVVATEMKNNSCKLARWAIQSILAGSQLMKLGYVSRANPRDVQRHVILGVAGYKPKEFLSQMNLSLSNAWGIVRTIVDLCLGLPEGKYVLVKDPNKSIIRLYSVPSSTFEESNDPNLDDLLTFEDGNDE
ncbi:hypothetical protein T552_01632 [Pneumocystis carinii B80]|uniref:Eukaryotic translation initiation factor 3 subunit D n=1 Tax=Pneumocystis carinii (strain B80) TaxID=1408658 RepID=A0A0W4ZJ19_PNEC8|nr:hypothetical protein T552_01632 [Pneumocystis carinii B80]KTW28371.1 hypothetical protein T552_01632 [Pneumocystis carinii B80]